MIATCCINPKNHHGAVFDSYADRRFKKASLYVQSEMNQGFRVPPLNDKPRRSRPSALVPSFEEVAAQMPPETLESFKRMIHVVT